MGVDYKKKAEDTSTYADDKLHRWTLLVRVSLGMTMKC